MLFVWNGLPQLWSTFTSDWYKPFLAAFIALTLNEAAYMSEIIRAGLLSVDPGQELAGRALGMTRRQILRRVVVPQAVRLVIPPTGNEFITLLKLTSLAFVISLHELLTAAQELAASTFTHPEPLVASLAYYLVIVSILMLVQARLERRFTWDVPAKAATPGNRHRVGGLARRPLMADVVLRAASVEKRYGDLEVVKGVTLEVDRGQETNSTGPFDDAVHYAPAACS